jgi:uncharacterized protein (TIGR03435 family)
MAATWSRIGAACDDAVLREAEGTDYAEQLVTMAERFADVNVQPVLSMANRSDLSTRIRAVLDADQRRGEARDLRVTAAIVSALMLALVIAPLRATNGPQSPLSASNSPRFDVAAVRLNVSGDLRVNISTSPGGRFTARNVPLRVLIRRAYELQEFQLEGGPKWLDGDRFDVVAQGEASATPQQRRLMLQALLADRFNLELHREMRNVPLYALVMSRRDGTLGPALRRSEADCGRAASVWDGLGPSGPPDPTAPCGFVGPAPGGAAAKLRGVTLEALARFLSTPVRRPVIDRTGLTGYFDADLEMTAELGPPPPPPGVADRFDRSSAPSIFTALQEQLGLKLDARKGPVVVFVIDRLEHPTED